MFISLRMQNFRSYTDGQFEFEDGVTIIVGPNGSGKTSLIEALLVLCTGSSYKVADIDLIRYGSDWMRLDGVLAGGEERTLKLKFEEDNVRKSYTLQGVERVRLTAQQKLPVILFEPQDMNIVTGEPSLRRDFLDTILGSTDPHYASNLKNYRRALSQRNTLLKRPNAPRPDELFVWDLRLSELGGVVHAARKQLLQDFSSNIQDVYYQISGKHDIVSVAYVSDENTADYAEAMLSRLSSGLHKDIARGFTGTGPHRDDMLLTIRCHDAKVAASRGETRSLLLSLKLLQLKALETATGKKPLILLDDVFSELDGARRQALAAALQGYQTLITTTDADLVIEHFTDKAHIIALTAE